MSRPPHSAVALALGQELDGAERVVLAGPEGLPQTPRTAGEIRKRVSPATNAFHCTPRLDRNARIIAQIQREARNTSCMNKLSSSGKTQSCSVRGIIRTYRNRGSACRGRSSTLNFAGDICDGVVIVSACKRVAMLASLYCCPAGAFGSTGFRASCFAISFSLLFWDISVRR